MTGKRGGQKGPRGSYEEPLSLDMGADQALARFAQTDPAEADEFANEPEVSTDADLVIYGTRAGARVEARMIGDEMWLPLTQVARLFGRDLSGITRHVKNIVSEGELSQEGNLQKMQVTPGAKPATLLSLDMAISVGYRVSSVEATMFRIWATTIIKTFLIKGFALDDERLRDPDRNDYFAELRERIRDIRASEANLYKEVRTICALCNDYGTLTDKQKNLFFATIQNKLIYAVVQMTAAEVRVERADASKLNMGLTTWAKDRLVQEDAMIAKNYFGEAEMRDFNRFTGMLLDYFEQETELRRVVTMADAASALDKFVQNNERPLLRGAGAVSAQQADDHVRAQYKAFNEQRRIDRHQRADGELFELVSKAKALPKPKKK